MSNTKKLVFSGLIIAIYIVVMYFTQSFAFGEYQIRIATSIYSLSYLFPFLVLPLSLANCLSNIIGGNGIWDIVGGFIVGFITSGGIYLIRKFSLPKWLIILMITFGPGLTVPIWLSFILNIPYIALAVSLCIGQLIAGIFAYILVTIIERYIDTDTFEIKKNITE